MRRAISDEDQPTHRLIPTRHPPVAAFETVASPSDLEAIFELEGWTNDRLVLERLKRLPVDRWVYGRANASVIMASFLHAQPQGARFTNADLGAWYCAYAERTAIAEVAHGMRREAVRAGWREMRGEYRCYRADLDGDYEDVRREEPERSGIYDPGSWAAGQAFGEKLRAVGCSGIIYDSVRHVGGTCVVAFDPRNVLNVTVGASFDILAPVDGKVVARRLS